MAFLSEAQLEGGLLELLESLGYETRRDEEIGPDSAHPERESHDEVILQARLEAAVERLNPTLPPEPRDDAVKQVMQSVLPDQLAENRRLHKLLIEGVEVEYYNDEGLITPGRVRLIDFADPAANDWLAVSQFVVIHGQTKRRPDVVLFVNGMPVVVVELKAPGSEQATMQGALNQLQNYKQQIPQLFRTNALLVTSDGLEARVGSLSAGGEWFMPWRTTDGAYLAAKGTPEMDTLIEGVCDRGRLLELMRHFTVFAEMGSGVVKIIAGYHQFHAVRKAVEHTVRALPAPDAEAGEVADDKQLATRMREKGDRRVGVIWHTQGSGKSLLMAFYAGQLVKHPALENPTLVVLTDRNDLDEQLFDTFCQCRELLRQTPVRAGSRDELKDMLNRASGGVIFTTIQKFGEGGPLTERRNVVVIADEAHRSNYGFGAKVDRKTGAISYGFAKYVRDALPRASFIGFTGTPIEADDVNTPAVFGDYIDIYDITRAVEDGATVPLYYESRLARIELDEAERPKIDAEVEELLDDEADDDRERMKQKWTTQEAVVGADKRLRMVAEDLVNHFEERIAALDGKGMVVCMSRRICVNLYEEIVRLRPGWHSEDDTTGVVKVVMTGSSSDPKEWQGHVRSKSARDLLAKRARDASDPLRLVIVRDMWLTGFNAPSMHTMYVDKPMRGHGLMQAIARVNRVFRDKPAGLIVDYIGIAQNLKKALGRYSDADKDNTGIDESQAVALLQEKYEIVRAMFHGFDYLAALAGTPQERLAMMAGAIDWILQKQQEWAAAESDDVEKKKAHRRYADAVLQLSKAFALAGATDLARKIREEVGFFQAIRAALVKSSASSGRTAAERELAIQQIVSRAVISTEIVDILQAAGLQTPDISILSDEFLAEILQLERKNLALEALRKLLNDGIRSRSKSNVVQTRAFTERLEAAMARYHTNAVSTAEVLQELIDLAKDIRAERARGEESGLTDDEIAFYDALAENESAVEAMKDDQLRVIAHELLTSLKANASVDWAHRENARAKMRVLVKRILRKYGYPPDLQDAAVQTVLAQAEALSAAWSAA